MERKQIVLTVRKRAELEQFSSKGTHNVRLVNRAKIILALDTPGGRKPETQQSIAERVGVSRQAVNGAKCDFLAANSVSEFLQRKKRETPPIPQKTTGENEARIIALARGKAPAGCSRWTLRLLAAKCVELHYFGTMSHMTISRLLKKHSLNLT